MTHEFDGKKYEKASAHQKEWGTKLIKELGLKGTEHVLDPGSDGNERLRPSLCRLRMAMVHALR
jgi:hypothetical protein